ncbi:ankyrin repeat domain-containing protein [Puniceicoccaceae bacterium K14]|nr:ankyrin repeat domain-containing protein [Puniceicoccaceae bacterium K14]
MKIILIVALLIHRSFVFADVRVMYTGDEEALELVRITGVAAVVRDADGEAKKDLGYGFPFELEGELPLDPEFAWALNDYEFEMVSRPYYESEKLGERIKPKYFFHGSDNEMPWSQSDVEEGILVYAWVNSDGYEFFLLRCKDKEREGLIGNISKFDFDAQELRESYLVCWLIRDGELVKKEKMGTLDVCALRNLSEQDFADLKPHIRDELGNTALHVAAMNGDVDLALRLSKNWRKKAFVQNNIGNTPLMLAAKLGRTKVVEALLESGWPVEARNDFSQTALILAAQGGHYEIVEILFAAGASFNLDALTIVGSAVFVDTIDRHFEDVAIALMKKGASVYYRTAKRKLEAIHHQLAEGYPRLGMALVEEFSLKTLENELGLTPMHLVAGYADVELLERVSELNLNSDHVSRGGLRPLDFAIASGNTAAICWFVENSKDEQFGAVKNDAITAAVSKGQLESVQCLLSYGYDANVESEKGGTPMMLAVRLGYREIAEALLNAGGSWNLSNSSIVEECLVRIIEMDSITLLESVLEQGIDVKLPLYREWSPGELAWFYGAQSILNSMDDLETIDRDFLVSTDQLDEGIEFIEKGEFDYTDELADKFGELLVKVSVGVDRIGNCRIFDFDNTTPKEVKDGIEAVMKDWKIKTPKKGGVPVGVRLEIELSLRVRSLAERSYEMKELSIPPRPEHQVSPSMLMGKKTKKKKGTVDMEWIIDNEGNCVAPRVLNSSDSSLVYPAVQSILISKFYPGEIDGKAVSTRVRQRIVFLGR